MSPKKPLITLVGSKQAKEGFTFLHRGSAPKCEGCKYFHVCVKNLEAGRVYGVVGLREKEIRCGLAETDMRVVEVVESRIESAIPSRKAIEGAIILFQLRESCVEDCVNLKLCSPEGLYGGDRCEIVEITGSLQCPRGFPLVRVFLRRVPAS